MTNVADFEKAQLKRYFTNLKSTGYFSESIESIVKDLENSKWKVKLHDFSVEDDSAFVDYEKKELSVNIFKAFMAYDALSRIHTLYFDYSYDKGQYVYSFEDGEEFFREDGSNYYAPYLVVRKL